MQWSKVTSVVVSWLYVQDLAGRLLAVEPELNGLQQTYDSLGSQQRSRQLEAHLAQLVEKWHQLSSLATLLQDRCVLVFFYFWLRFICEK